MDSEMSQRPKKAGLKVRPQSKGRSGSPSEEAPREEEALQVIKDQTFSRSAADKVIVVVLGRDLELSLLQFSPSITSIQDAGDSEELKMGGVWNEVHRARMDWGTAVTSAMHIIERGIYLDRVKPEAVLAAVQSLVDAKSSGKGDSDE
jgi:hypothetical protein